jgi:tetratricopeptide (TPR) repeat protein
MEGWINLLQKRSLEGPILMIEARTGQSVGKDSEPAEPCRLDSWKEIATFFRREVRTVQLWEQHEFLPVHRHQHRKVGTVYAYKSELRDWWKQRCIGRNNGSALPQALPKIAGSNSISTLPPQITLAVLPFESLSGDLADPLVVNGLTEQIAERIDSLMPARLRVTCSLAVAQRHAEGFRLEAAAGKPDADYSIHGSIRCSPEQTRIQLYLMRVKGQSTIWSSEFEYAHSDLQNIQADLAEKVSRALSNHVLMSRHVIKSITVKPAARYAYLRGRYLWSLRSSPSSMFKAMEQFKLATAIDPNHAQAFSGLADCHAVLGWLGAIPREFAMREARNAALTALAIDGSLAEAHVSMGCILFDFDWDWEGAEREFLLGIDLNPAYSQGYCWYGHVLVALGRNREAINAAQIAQDMDPTSPMVGLFLGSALFHDGQFDAAIQQYQHVLHMQPDHAMAHRGLGLAYEQAGDLLPAIAHLRIAAGGHPNDESMQAALAYAHAKAGERGKAETLLRGMRQGADRENIPSIDAAAAFTALGNHETAIRYLYLGFEQRDARLTKLKCDPRLLPLHTDPRFASLAKQMRLS